MNLSSLDDFVFSSGDSGCIYRILSYLFRPMAIVMHEIEHYISFIARANTERNGMRDDLNFNSWSIGQVDD
jgi:hypothetical protein